MKNSNEYPVGFYFSLSFEGENVAFKEVSGITKEFGVKDITNGGESRFKYRLPTANSSKNLVLKRAIVPLGSKLIAWCSETLNDGLGAAIQTKDVSVELMDNDSKILMKWTFYNSYPVKYSLSDLKSQESELLIETVELAYAYFDMTPST
ncbi:phage tail protein [uncultured Psychroserpens sp.]|uniref:phage tail protein n=1 Tax=uncultured Psychroserpens sp. TaxID=255436 RepID=UPI00260CF5FA|nr:phage tail protein [uncultured Psychroserpens sp.]